MPPPAWSDFEQAAVAGKEILERLAGDRTTLRRLLFTAPDRWTGRQLGLRSPSGGLIRLSGDGGPTVFLHLGSDSGAAARTISEDAVVKVLAGHLEHIWFQGGEEVGYVTREQPPGLFAIRAGLEHSLAWSGGTASLIVCHTEPEWTTAAAHPLDRDRHISLCYEIDSLGVV
jgi:CubicO group peptidase (beta-lactamase class C family)